MRLIAPVWLGLILMVLTVPPPASASTAETVFGVSLLIVAAIIGVGWEISARLQRLDPGR